jgi:hypothetical protein
MAISKKGFRKIEVNEHLFLWKVRKKISWEEKHDGPLKIPIQSIKGGQLLIAMIAFSRSGYGYYTLETITPNLIRKCILRAIKLGWDFGKEGKAFELDCQDL